MFPRFGLSGPGKASVLIGCHIKACIGTVSLKITSRLCHNCIASARLHFHLLAGVQKTLSLRLTELGRMLLVQHPGLAIESSASSSTGAR